ncbi:MAG: NAD(P)H-dependent oxidoreductase subunit E [Fusobacteriaceae bacterium]
MPCKNQEKERCYKELEKFIEKLSEREGSLISVLHKGQEIFGYIPEEVQIFIAEKLELPLSKVYGVVSFYHYFTMVPKGKFPISVCMGTACYVRGAEKILKRFKEELAITGSELTKDGLFSIDALRCVGACGLAPVVLIGDDIHGKLKVEDVKGLIEKYKNKE